MYKNKKIIAIVPARGGNNIDTLEDVQKVEAILCG